MKKMLFLSFLLTTLAANAQLLSWAPDFIQESSGPVSLTMDASFGNKGLMNYSPTSDVYVHIGVITNFSSSSSDWKHVLFSWGTTIAGAQCSYAGSNKWTYSISNNLRGFFGLTDPAEKILKIAVLFRNGNGSKVERNADGSDMFVPVYDNGVYARIDVPYKQPLYNPVPEPIIKNIGDALSMTAKASQPGDTLKIYFNGNLLSSAVATSATVSSTIVAAGTQQIIAKAVNTSHFANSDTINFTVAAESPTAPLPAGVKDGINYENGDTSVTLVLFAPLKKGIFVIGDFNNWTATTKYLMNVTPDKQRFWIRLTGLGKGTEYGYQFLIDAALKVADYNAEKILDPVNDTYIDGSTYPNLKAYPMGKTTGIVSVLQTGKTSYPWAVANYNRPDKRNLVVYELLLRDFLAAHNWQTLKDTLNYLKGLGVNAIEVMPFNEFEGNSSWGYNPSFYFAPDKYYGTETALKQFIDECHKKGFAIIMDMVLNHSFGASPMVQMYWDTLNNRPAATSPWFNPLPKHPYNVGYDINHESQATIDFVNRVIRHWLINYKIDGFRWDLSKGFTQKNSCTTQDCNTTAEVNNWGAYDSSRVTIWKRYYGFMESASPGSYCILEHFAANDEEKELANAGMLLWGNENYNYNQATMGYASGWDFSNGIYSARGWSQPNLVTYQESHDEERLMYKNEQFGNNNGAYNVKNTTTGLRRNGMAAAFWSMEPGPKMMWEFGELGYDLTINRCTDGSVNNACRTDPKSPHWDYYQNVDRKALYDVYSKLLTLRSNPKFLTTFASGAMNYDLSGSIKWQSLSSDSLDIMVMGNFDVLTRTGTVTFPATGTWYSYLTDSVTTVGSTSVSITLQPGEYFVFTNRDIKSLILPVQWLRFTAQKTGSQTVELRWSIGSELNNDHFEIQRSGDGVNFSTIGYVLANKEKQYIYADTKPLRTGYYRVKQIDKDARYGYSRIIKVAMEEAMSFQLLPNPARNTASLYSEKELSGVQILMTDLSGKIVYQHGCGSLAAGQQVLIDVQKLARGVYILKVMSDQGTKTKKLAVD